MRWFFLCGVRGYDLYFIVLVDKMILIEIHISE